VTIERSITQEAYLKASEPGDSDHFGYTMAASGEAVFVTAWFEDSGASGVNGDATDNSLFHVGAAYGFERRGDRWMQEAYFKPSDPSSRALFVASVAIAGDTLAIGARERDDDLTTPDGPGAVHIFTRTAGVWSHQVKLTPTQGGSGQSFGDSVALEGDTLVVGADTADSSVSGSGAVYVFQRSGDSWMQPTKLVASTPSRGTLFGSEVAISGNTLAVAAQEEGTSATRGGAVYVFERAGKTWTGPQRLQPLTAIENGTFGFSLALRGNTLAIGAPRGEWLTTGRRPSGEVYMFERSADGWKQTAVLKAARPAISDYFGWSVALSDTALLVGAMGDSWGGRGVTAIPGEGDAGYSGGAYLFARDGQAWIQSAYFKASNADPKDGFGYSVALSDGAAFVGAVFEKSRAKGVNGEQDDNSLMDSGAVYVFR